MVLTAHIATSAVIIDVIPNKILALFFVLISHFILDAIPHAQAPTDAGYKPNNETYKFVFVDFVFSVGLIMLLSQFVELNILLIAAFISVLPDIFDMTRYTKIGERLFKLYHDFHDKI